MEKLTHQEEEIMLVIWKKKRGIIKDFLEQLPEPQPPYTTVASIVKNLEKKGFLGDCFSHAVKYFGKCNLQMSRNNRVDVGNVVPRVGRGE